MKRVVLFVMLSIALVSISAIAVSAQDSLGDVAKKAQAQKKSPAKKVYTNDDIPSVVIPATEKDAATSALTGDTRPATDKESAPKDEKAETAGSDKPDYKKAVADQQAKVADLERELNLMEREHQLKVSTYYADAGNQLRDSKKWFEDEKKYQDDLDAKKKSLAGAKDKLSQIEEEARKSGAPVKVE